MCFSLCSPHPLFLVLWLHPQAPVFQAFRNQPKLLWFDFSFLLLFFSFRFSAPMYHMTRHTLAYHTLLMCPGCITNHYYDTLSNNLTYNTCLQYITKRLAEPVHFPWKDGCERCVVLHEDIACTLVFNQQ